jgi:hypothetical protein
LKSVQLGRALRRLGEERRIRVVVALADTADQRFDAGEHQALGGELMGILELAGDEENQKVSCCMPAMVSGPRNHLDLRSGRPSGGPFAFERNCENSGQIATNVDLKSTILGRQDGLFPLPAGTFSAPSAAFERDYLLVEAVGNSAFQDEVEEGIDFAVDFLDLCLGRFDRRPAFHSQPVRLACELVAEFLE